jgi:acyl carrier protein
VTPETEQMIQYIVNDVIRRPGTRIDEKSPLVSSGLIDSMSLVEILLKLEDVTHRRIPAGKVQAKDMDTVELMMMTAQRVGKLRP